jgi:hypothetical protein
VKWVLVIESNTANLVTQSAKERRAAVGHQFADKFCNFTAVLIVPLDQPNTPLDHRLMVKDRRRDEGNW